MDPSAHFNHSELSSEQKSLQGWQKLSIDRVTNCCFDPSGRLCAVYFNHSSIELWDVTSVPVPMTMLLLPKNISGRFEGICHSLAWSADGSKLIGAFGPKAVSRRRTITTNSGIASDNSSAYNEDLKGCHVLIWDIRFRLITHKFRQVLV